MKTIKYRKAYCEELIKWMGKGKSYITWGAKHDPRIATSTQYNWEKDFPEWKEAKRIGYALGLDYYENLLQSVMLGIVPGELKALGSKNINLTAVIFTLKTRFHNQYGEISKVDHSNKDGTLNNQMSKEEKLEMIEKYKSIVHEDD